MSYFKKHWPVELHGEVLKCVENIVSSGMHQIFQLSHMVSVQGMVPGNAGSAQTKHDAGSYQEQTW